MDQTAIFKQIIEKLSLDDKNFKHGKHQPKKLNQNNKNGTVNTKLRELVSSITYMRDYLMAKKKDYINIYNSILSMSSKMTDEERDQIDKDVQDFVKLCNDVIKILRVEIKSRISKQQYEHENIAISLVEAYNKTIYEIHNKQKALRLKRNLESQNFFRLSKSLKKNGYQSDQKNDDSDSDPLPKENTDSEPTVNKSLYNQSFFDDYNDENDKSYDISPEEQKIFKLEGKRIYDEMNSMQQEVKNVAKKLTEISKLQEVFSENVMKQESDLQHLNDSTIQSTEYIREGNEQLKEAMRKNAGFRVWILFFITTLAFVVLFLDWYNP